MRVVLVIIIADEFEASASDGALKSNTMREMPDHGVPGLAVLISNQIRVIWFVCEQFAQVASVKVFAHWLGSLRESKQGWVEVQAVYHNLRFNSFGNAWPGYNQRHPGTTLHRGYFSLIQGVVVCDDFTGVTFHTSIVRSENNIGVLGEFVTGPTGIFGLQEHPSSQG